MTGDTCGFNASLKGVALLLYMETCMETASIPHNVLVVSTTLG